jgi:threonine dehydrogenase-like Zn-dependent dehydrogenase
MTMLAAQLMGARELRVSELADPEANDGEAVLEVAACGICGSDLHAYRSFTLARAGRVLGHEFSGVVIDAPNVEGVAVGSRVVVRPQMPCHKCAMCLAGQWHLCVRGVDGIIGYGYDGGFAERVLIPAPVVGETIFSLPAGVDDRGGALVEPLSVGLHAAKQAGDISDAVVLVLGAGMIGLAATQFLRLRGARTILVSDPSARRRDAAALLGADLVIDPANERGEGSLRQLSAPGGEFGPIDVVIDCAGAEQALVGALRAVRPLGTLVLCALYGEPVPVPIDWIVGKELSVKGAFAYVDEFPEVIAALAAGHIDPGMFVSHEFPLAEIEVAFQAQLNSAASLKVLVCPKATNA